MQIFGSSFVDREHEKLLCSCAKKSCETQEILNNTGGDTLQIVYWVVFSSKFSNKLAKKGTKKEGLLIHRDLLFRHYLRVHFGYTSRRHTALGGGNAQSVRSLGMGVSSREDVHLLYADYLASIMLCAFATCTEFCLYLPKINKFSIFWAYTPFDPLLQVIIFKNNIYFVRLWMVEATTIIFRSYYRCSTASWRRCHDRRETKIFELVNWSASYAHCAFTVPTRFK